MSSMAIHEVENIDREVKNLLKEIEKKIQDIQNGVAASSVSLPLSASHQVAQKIDYCKSRIKTMEIELSTVENREAARKFKPVIRDHRNTLREYEQELSWNPNAAGAGGAPSNKYGVEEDDILRNEDAAIGYGRKLQDETQAAASRALRDLQETNEVAVNTATMLHEQTEQIEQIDKNLAEIDDEIDRAGRVLKRMGRRVMTDKYIWCLIFLIFSAIIVIIVVAVVEGKVDENDVKPNFRRRLAEQLGHMLSKQLQR